MQLRTAVGIITTGAALTTGIATNRPHGFFSFRCLQQNLLIKFSKSQY